MAMVFTLVSQLQESLHNLVNTRVKRREQEAADIAKREIEVRTLPASGTHKFSIPNFVERRSPHAGNTSRSSIVCGMETQV